VYTFPDGTLRPCAARYGIRSVYAARVDDHVHGCVWDVYATVYMAGYRRVHGPRPQRAVSARVHGRVGLPAMYKTGRARGRVHEHLQSRVRAVYMARVYGCVLAVYTAAYRPCRTV